MLQYSLSLLSMNKKFTTPYKDKSNTECFQMNVYYEWIL